jgi:hypothetical protein
MFMQRLMFVSLSATLSAAAAGVQAAPEVCVLSKYAASSAAPYSAEENVGYGSYTVLKGAQVFVPAREGLTEQWLTRDVQNALAEGCQLPERNVTVQVVSGGNGFWVQLIAANEQQGKQLLSWAQRLVNR